MPNGSHCATAVLSTKSWLSTPTIHWGWALLLLGPPILTALLLAVVWGLSLRQLGQEQALALAAVRQENETLAYVVAANLDLVLTRPQQYINRAIEVLDQSPGAGESLRTALAEDGIYQRLAVVNNRGRVQFASSPLALSSLPRKAKVSGINLEASNSKNDEAWLLPITHPLRSLTGREGYLVMHLDLGYFLRLYQGAGLGARSIGIFGEEGVKLVEADDLALSVGTNQETAPQERQVVVTRQLEHVPLWVKISQSEPSVLQRVEASRRSHLIWAWSLTLLLITVGAAMFLLALRQKRLYRRVRLSEVEKLTLIQQLEEEKGQAYQLASHDHLTGLPNRMLFSELAASHLSDSRRGHHFHALIFLDLDRFKLVNDQLGHHVGDLLLQTVAKRLRAVVRDSDLVARQGGDEFVLLINKLVAVEDVAHLATSIIQAVGTPCHLDGHDLEIRPSLGIALAPNDGMDLPTLMANADKAMYAAKAAGRSTFRFFDQTLNGISVRQEELAEDLVLAFENDSLLLHYQQQISLRDMKPLGLEALLRWQHPRHGIIYPRDIMPLVSELRLFPKLGGWMLQAVCKQFYHWQEAGYQPLPISISLVPEMLADPSFLDDLLQLVRSSGIQPVLLVLDIPATWILEAESTALARLEELASDGVSLRAEGFWRGQSSFHHLGGLSLKWLKVELSCIGEAEAGKVGGGMGSFIITLAHMQGFKVLVTGVETPEQLVQIKVIGANGVQGSHLHRPVTAEEIIPLLERRPLLNEQP